jgi:hypothetical protein
MTITLLPLTAMGCGGATSSISSPKHPVIYLGGVTSANGTTVSALTIPATGGAMTTTTINGQSLSVLIPSGLDAGQFPGGQVPPNTLITVMSEGQALIKGNYGQGGSVSLQSPAPNEPGQTAGPVVVNSGIAVDAGGRFTTNVALPMGLKLTSYQLTFPAVSIPVTTPSPRNTFDTAGAKDPPQVTVNVNISNVKVQGGCGNSQGNRFPQSEAGFTDVPTSIDGSLPGNGQPLAGSTVNIKWANANNDGRLVTIKLSWPGVSIQQTQTIQNGAASFASLGRGNEVIPENGIDTFEVDIAPRSG